MSILFVSSDGRDHDREAVSRSGMAECQEVKFCDFFASRLLVDSFLIACGHGTTVCRVSHQVEIAARDKSRVFRKK